MKKSLILFAALNAYVLYGQEQTLLGDQAPDGAAFEIRKYKPKEPPYRWQQGVSAFFTGAFGGACNGIHETIVFRYDNFKRFKPSVNDQYWDPSISWKNKYRYGDKQYGPKFMFSTNLLVGLTDAKHLFGQARTAAVFATGITVAIGDKKPWWHYGANALLGAIGYGTAFHIVYDRVYGDY